MSRTKLLSAGWLQTAEPGSAIVPSEAESTGHRLRDWPPGFALSGPGGIRGAGIWRDPPADQAKDANRKEILFHRERDREPDATLRHRMRDGNGSDRALTEGCRASQTSTPRNMRFARAIRSVWASDSTSARTTLRPADVRW